MFRAVTRLGPITLSSVFPVTIRNTDNVVVDSSETFKHQTLTGSQRIRALFYIDEFGEIAPELNFILQSTFGACMAGAIYGGFIHSRTAYMNFIEGNEATQFKHVFEAKKSLQDKVAIGFAKGAFRWGWRLSFFTVSYTLITTCIAVYRGKNSMLEYMAAGAVTGGLYKATLGLRASIVGGTLGLILGSFVGGTSLLILKMSGMTMEEVHKHQYRWRERRINHRISLMDASAKESQDEVTKYHDMVVKEIPKETEPETKK